MRMIDPKFTHEDLRHMPDDGRRYEIIEGELVVSPSPKWRHQRCVWNLAGLLRRAEEAGFGVAVAAPMDVVFSEHSVTEPDLLFIAKERQAIVTEDNVQGAPDLVIEVLSESTRDRDLRSKLHLYAVHGVRWYWVVAPDAEVVRRFELADGAYAEQPTLHAGDVLACPAFPGVEIDTAEVFRP